MKKCSCCGTSNDMYEVYRKDLDKLVIYNICRRCRNSKISKSTAGKQRRPLTEQHKAKIRLSRANQVITKESRLKAVKTIKKRYEIWPTKRLLVRKKISIAVKQDWANNEHLERKKNMSKALVGKRKGVKFSKEHCQKIGLSNKGKKRSKESRRKMSIRSKGNCYAKGHVLSKEVRKKLSIATTKYISTHPNKQFVNTLPERQLKELFKKNDIKFIHQFYVKNIEHCYSADFYLPDYNCIVEADGQYWHNYPKGNDNDRIRTKEMQQKGYNVLRFWEGQITESVVLQKLSELAS